MFLLVKQVSKPNATLEQTQEPSPKPSLCELPLQGTTGNGLAIHTQLCLISANEEVRASRPALQPHSLGRLFQ